MITNYKAVMGTALLALGSINLNAAAEDHAHKDHYPHSETHYVKPGAAVSLTHDYDGSTDLGEFETLTFSLHHIYDDGYITTSLLSPDGLKIESGPLDDFTRVSSGSVITSFVQFSSTDAGLYSLGVEIIYEDTAGHQTRRVLSIPISIGPISIGPISIGETTPTKDTGQSQTKDNVIAGTTRSNIIGLPAVEVIR